jgi:hypothetical protein
MAGDPVEIQTGYLPNTSEEHCHYTSQPGRFQIMQICFIMFKVRVLQRGDDTCQNWGSAVCVNLEFI